MLKSEAFPSRFLKAGDLNGKEITVTIAFMAREEIGQEKKVKPVLHFEGGAKPMVLNGVDWDRLELAFGDSDAWPGHKATLFSERVPFGNKTVDGIRLRPVVVKKPLAEDLNDKIPI